ncbi:unnamed protein product [Arctogadus glacialis]
MHARRLSACVESYFSYLRRDKQIMATAGNKKNFVWSDEEVELLLQVTQDYKATKTQQGVDWESCQTKYTDIWTAFIEQHPTPPDGQPRVPSYPHATDEINKPQIASKLKAVRMKYRGAVDTQRKSGHGRVITLFFDLCNDIWGGSPATTSLESGIETAEVNGDTVDSCSESSISEQTEESVSPQTSSIQTPLQRRRGLLQARLDGHRGERLQKKLCVDPVQTDLDMKRKIVDIMEKAERRNSARLDTIAEAHVRMSNSFDVLVRHLCQPQPNRAPPMQYYTAPAHSYTPPPMAPVHSYTPPPMAPAHSYTAPPMGSAHSYTTPPMGSAQSHTTPPMGSAHSHTAQQMGPAPQSCYRQLLEGHSDEEDHDPVSW